MVMFDTSVAVSNVRQMPPSATKVSNKAGLLAAIDAAAAENRPIDTSVLNRAQKRKLKKQKRLAVRDGWVDPFPDAQ